MTKLIQKIKRISSVLTASLLCAVMLSSCKGIELDNKTEQVEEYTKEQAMILIGNERCRYEKAYSPEIWKVQVDEDGSGFDRLVVQNVREYMEQLKLICMLAEERGIAITSQERDKLRQLTEEYLQKLTDADRAYTGAGREEVLKLYSDLFLANKLINSIVDPALSDISDSEAKVIRIQMIGTSDVKKAKAILKRAKIDGADFSSLASRYNEAEQTDVTLMRGRDEGLLGRVAFQLEEGQISNILCIGETYYIIKCVNGYDAEATRSRKAGLRQAINQKSFRAIYEPYQAMHKIRFMEYFWNEIDFSDPEGPESECFFDLYDQYFN